MIFLNVIILQYIKIYTYHLEYVIEYICDNHGKKSLRSILDR